MDLETEWDRSFKDMHCDYFGNPIRIGMIVSVDGSDRLWKVIDYEELQLHLQDPSGLGKEVLDQDVTVIDSESFRAAFAELQKRHDEIYLPNRKRHQREALNARKRQ